METGGVKDSWCPPMRIKKDGTGYSVKGNVIVIDGLQTLESIRERAVELPAIAGVYFLFLGDLLVYVGRSDNISRRIWKEHLGNKIFDRVAWIEMSHEEATRWEPVYIYSYSPKYNCKRDKLIHIKED